MNVFDAGGATTIIAVIVTLILSVVIFMLINKMFEIIYLGCGAIGTVWFICFIISAFLVNFLAGIAGGLIKTAIVVGILGSVGMFFYKKLNSKKE